MPGYANWQTLYREEYFQLYEEGYQLDPSIAHTPREKLMPFPDDIKLKMLSSQANEEDWELAYNSLLQIKAKGIRSGYSFVEPVELNEIQSAAGECEAYKALSDQEYRERIRGAWYGRCGAVVLGKPLEMGYDRIQVKEYLESVNSYPLCDFVPHASKKLGITLREDCIPSTLGNVAFVQPDDDIHYTILALLLIEQRGANFTLSDVGQNWLDNIPYHWVWCASRQVYYHLVNANDRPPDEELLAGFATKLNPWRECIDGQIRGDFWGYICPGQPAKAAEYAYRECSLSLVKNGVYGAMFVAGMISAAISSAPDAEKIILGGLSVIPPKSRLACAVKKVMEWYTENADWIEVCDKIYADYGHLSFADTINNLSIVTLSLLYGKLDYTKSITTAVMCGMDTDCNAATVGSVVGAARGYQGLTPQFITPLNDIVKTAVAAFGEGTISDLAERTIRVKKGLE